MEQNQITDDYMLISTIQKPSLLKNSDKRKKKYTCTTDKYYVKAIRN